MPEPVTIAALAVGGLSWVIRDASGVVGGIAGNVGDRALQAIGRAAKDRIAGLRGLPENHDVARAVRLAQMQALERSLRDWRETGLPQWRTEPPEVRQFCEAGLEFCARTSGRCLDMGVKLNLDVTEPLTATIEGILGQPVAEAPAGRRAEAFAAFAEEAVLDELRSVLPPGVVVPAAFAAHLRAGDGGQRPRFMQVFGHYIAEQIKHNQPFHAILTTGQLARIEGLAFDAAEMLDRIEKHFGGALAAIQAGVERIEASASRIEKAQRISNNVIITLAAPGQSLQIDKMPVALQRRILTVLAEHYPTARAIEPMLLEVFSEVENDQS